ncbi:hypothetical protein C9374_011083 [Naegleria lovaniensis]|uniref:Uncharacterized protein n=1 Tax=Naegleria lovaniensis TaxID=51637 RepID=A0AA88GD06_NAELO|nr:uncharacterized protein C9374_011083 [Naegleria lovaniensis]KAG2374246.1 hypothetical protein C9374_011083 [Naegleria lovaniensis]
MVRILKNKVLSKCYCNTISGSWERQIGWLPTKLFLSGSPSLNITPNQFNSTPNCSQHAQTNVFPNADRAQINSPSGTSNNDFFSRLILSQQQQQAVDTKASLVTSPRTPRVTSPRGFSINRSGRSSSASYNYRRASMSSESLMSSFRSPSNHNNNFDPMVIGTLIASLSNNNNTNNNMNAMNGNNMMNATAANNMMFQNSMSGFLSNTNSNQNNTCISNNQGNNMSYPPQVVSPQQIPSQLSFLFQQQAQPQSMNVNTSSLSCTQPMTIVQHKQNRPQQLFLSRSYSPGTDVCTDNSITPRSMHSTDSELNSFSHLMLVDSESSTPRQGYSQAQNMESTSMNEEINACLDDIRAFMDENSFLPDEFRTFEFPAQTHQANSAQPQNEHLPQTEYCFFNTSTMNENKSNEDVALQQSAHDVASIPPVFNNNNNPSQQLSQPAAQTNPTEQDEIDEIEQFLSLFA